MLGYAGKTPPANPTYANLRGLGVTQAVGTAAIVLGVGLLMFK